MPLVTVIANCHCLPIARTLSLGARGIDADFIDINFLDATPHVERVRALAADDGSRIVLTFPFGAKWGPIATDPLRARYGARCATFTNVHFTGLHPDMTYIGAMGARVTAVMGDYHSKLVLYAYVSGRTADDCIAMFEPATFERIGYFNFFAASAEELRQREAECDVKFAEDFLALAREQVVLYTVNHPTDAVFQALCERLCAAYEIPFTPFPASYLNNSLSDNVIWPVYDAIAEHHGLRYRTPQAFVVATQSRSRAMSLEEVVRGFYASYAELPAREFATMVKSLPFFPQFQIGLGETDVAQA